MGPRRPMSVKFRKKVASYHPGSILNRLKKVHDDRVNGLVSYKGHAHTHRHTETYFDFYKYRYSEIKRHKGGPGLFGVRCQFQKPFHFNSISSGIYLLRSLKYEWKNILNIYEKRNWGPRPRRNRHKKFRNFKYFNMGYQVFVYKVWLRSNHLLCS